jgi:putative spermidine/putrescine transport system permease protein
VTIFLIGPEVITLPTRIFAHIQESASPVVGRDFELLVLVTIVLVVLLQRFVGLELFVEAETRR